MDSSTDKEIILTDSDKNLSALKANIINKGENAYYYAHSRILKDQEEKGKDFYGPSIINGGNPVLLEKKQTELECIKVSKKFEKYQFIDDDNMVQIRIDLTIYVKDPTLIKEDCVNIKFDEKTLDVRVNEPNGEPIFLVVKKLFKKADPEKCKFKLFKNKLIITIHKAKEDESWDKLNA